MTSNDFQVVSLLSLVWLAACGSVSWRMRLLGRWELAFWTHSLVCLIAVLVVQLATSLRAPWQQIAATCFNMAVWLLHDDMLSTSHKAALSTCPGMGRTHFCLVPRGSSARVHSFGICRFHHHLSSLKDTHPWGLDHPPLWKLLLWLPHGESLLFVQWVNIICILCYIHIITEFIQAGLDIPVRFASTFLWILVYHRFLQALQSIKRWGFLWCEVFLWSFLTFWLCPSRASWTGLPIA